MIVDQVQLDEIRRSRKGEGVFTLPVRYGRFGELVRCPARKGGVYVLSAPRPYDRWRARAAVEPTRARSVLWWIDRLNRPQPTVNVTVLDTEQQTINGADLWLCRYERGEHDDRFDTPLYLSGDGGFTTAISRQAIPGDPELELATGDGERARVLALAKDAAPAHETIARWQFEAGDLKRELLSMKARQRLRAIQKQLAELAAELPRAA